MVKRFSWRNHFYLAFALIVLLLSWENNRTNAALAEGEIPAESIRLRILANSDSVADQALKRRVRDAVVAEMNGWVSGPASIEEAREVVRTHLPELGQLVSREIAAAGFNFTNKVELGIVPFPAKMYGNKVYPAGDYEALRITIGSGEGQNWWCVLFPPLCFVDSASGEAVAKEKAGDAEKTNTIEIKKNSEERSQTAEPAKSKRPQVTILNASPEHSADSAQVLDTKEKKSGKKKFRFFFWDFLKSLFG